MFRVRRFIDQASWTKKPVTVATFFENAGELYSRTAVGTPLV